MPHIHDQIDFTVQVFIIHEGKLLLRYHDKYDFWGGPSGHIELNENPNEAVIREAKEEVGLDIKLYNGGDGDFNNNDRVKKLIAPSYMNIHKIGDTHRHVDMVYYATSDSNEVKPEDQSDRSDDWKWITKEELEELDMWDDIKFYALKAFEILG